MRYKYDQAINVIPEIKILFFFGSLFFDVAPRYILFKIHYFRDFKFIIFAI